MAANESALAAGFSLVAIQQQPVAGLPYHEILKRIRTSPRPLCLAFRPALRVAADDAAEVNSCYVTPLPVRIQPVPIWRILQGGVRACVCAYR
jgi:hypothetical protein